jgi:aspartyl-tRNA(Asn)/glutamyl-tRNA(Gln) amidotransferase subunit B
LNESRKTVEESPVSPEALAKLLDMIAHGVISGKIAKELFEIMWSEGGEVDALIESRGLRQISDTGALEVVLKELISKHPTQVEEYRGGKEKVFGFFVGQAMKATQGKANPAQLNELLKILLAGD